MNCVQVHFHHPMKGADLTMELPRDTRFSALTALLYERGFLAPQKPGYRYLYQNHLCGMNHALEDYIPEDAAEMFLEVFQFPAVLI